MSLPKAYAACGWSGDLFAVFSLERVMGRQTEHAPFENRLVLSPISPPSLAATRGPPRSPRIRSASTNSPGAPPGRPTAPSIAIPRPSTACARSPALARALEDVGGANSPHFVTDCRGPGARRCCTNRPWPARCHRQDPHLPIRYDTGRPSSVIRLRILQPRTTSLPCPAGLRARRPSPMMDLYRKNAFSTRP